MTIDGEEHYRKAGEISSRIRGKIPQIVKPGKPIIDICEEVENSIKDLGGDLAFPCNVGVNEIAAHYTSDVNDENRIPAKSLVKVDWGVSVNGYIADAALSIAFHGDYQPLIAASNQALEEAIAAFKPGIYLREIGSRIEKIITSFGLKPITNLTGHKMDQYLLHSGKTVPNVTSKYDMKILQGEVYAIEPFVTTHRGIGRVVEGPGTFIFRFVKEKGVKREEDKQLIRFINTRFNKLPFSLRWIEKTEKDESFRGSFQRLRDKGCVMGYPVLMEGSYEPVAQSEHTVLVRESDCLVLTA